MVQVTKGKNVVIETCDAEFKEFTATADIAVSIATPAVVTRHAQQDR